MSDSVHICCHAELNQLLAPAQRDRRFELALHKTRSVKDLIESLGIPHTEIDIILVDNRSVGFDQPIGGGESIEVFPAGACPRREPLLHNQPSLPESPGFVLDVHLGKLAGYLRLLGFDTLYRNDYDDPELARISDRQNRVLVSCDRKLLMRKRVRLGCLMRSRQSMEQVHELLSRFDLYDYRSREVRCMECNGIINAVAKADIESQLLPLTRQHYRNFFQCDDCAKIYWQGSHYGRLQTLVENIRAGRGV